MFILESSTERDFQKGVFVYWSYIESKAVFGGKYVWATAKFSQKYTILKPHHQLTIQFDAIFGCNFQSGAGYLGYSINNNTETQINLNQTVTIKISHSSSILYIAFQCYGQNNNVLDRYCALADYSIIVHYCSPFCLQCSNENTCITMDTYDTSIIKIDQSECGPQQFLDNQYFRCENCPEECEACFNEYECTQCYYPYQLYITKCILMCKSNQHFNELLNICEACNMKCKQCRNNKDWCIHCEEKHFRILNLNQCVCQSGYYDDNITPKCQVCHNLCISCYGPSNIACTQCIQLDKIQLNGNICDCQDGYYFDYSQFKCDQCNFKCQTCFSSFENSCLSCSNNQNRSLQGLQCICLIGFYELNDFCQQCPETEDTQLSQCYKRCGNDMKKWYNQPCDQVTCLLGFENINNICIPICGDLQINGDEECDDGNQIINDGCLNCRFQCPKQCNTCDQTTVFPCSDICGDGIITGFEECDDGNNIQFDGCYECKLDCQIQCTKCLRGQCYECQTYGWEINIETLMCIENCGDSIVIGREECDDGYNLDENDNCYQCKRLCRNDCKTCTSDGKTCLDCQIVGFKPQNYFCINICGDGYLAKDPYGRNSEECDDFNLINYDGCSSTCKFQCQNDVCKVCENRKCIECIDHYYLDVSKNQCLEKCNDGIVIGKEKCDDMNSLLHDGCYNCQLSCQPSCLICQITGCQSCQIGFRLILNQCINVCGDGLIVQGEDCDDGNISPFDGCHFCKFYCNPNCQLCVLGQCLSCYKEFVMIKGICMFSFHNPIGKVNENHHLFNQNQISNSFISFCRLQINGICLICDDFYYLNKLDSKCESRCGDNVINNLEECEHNLTYKIRVCSACKFQCQDNCKECYFGFCQKCEQDYLLIKQTNECKIKVQCNPEKGLYYNDILNQCYEICGDGIISENEQCEDYNLDPYDGCYDCKYSCYSHCPLCIQGVCTDDGSTCQKGYYFDKETGFCFNVCGDGIIAIPDEECDEINNTDCVNCKKINEKNCKIFNEINKCVACLDNFQIVDEVCQPEPKQICDVQSCVNCQNNICIQSSQTQINNQNQENIILYYCGDGLINQNEFCDDGNFINGDGCDSNCQPSLNSICQLNECIQIFYPSPQIKYIQQIQNCQILTLYYDQYVKLSNNSTLEKYLNTLSGKVENTQVNVSFDSNTSEPFDLVNLEINIKIEYFYKIIDPIFILNFADPSIILNQHDSKQQMMLISIQLPSPNLLSIKEQSTTESIIKFSGYQIQIIAAVILISSITGEFQIIENQIEIIQMLYYYKYINIIKGQNLDKFFETFKIIQLANFFEYIGFLPQTYFFFSITKESSNSIFQADGRSSNFLFGFLQIFFILFIAYSTHIFIKIVIKFANHKIAFLKTQQLKQYQLKIVNKLLKFLIKNNGNQFKTKFEMIFQSLLYEHVINTMLSFQYQNYESTEGKISLILNISLSIWLVLYLMNQETQRCIKLKQTYSCLQKIIFGIILVGCFECPIIQIQLCALNEIFYFSFLYIKKNKIKQINTYKDLFKHLTFFFMDMIYLMHEFQKKDPQQLVILGWIQIGIMSSNLTLILIFDLYQILQPIIQKLRKGYARVENCLKQPKRNFANHELFDKGDSILQPQKI
ncbi:unnamed protein product [Paramecium sonneborni]|uniref:Insulin-like growth factor binding protein, N-terminal n=1 Tax=Paramecium sonneborni TaxID=65129 RepID=A0A8S1N2C4_9CILI|nr:unnamed protein product [Paramecium sonneborni]